jgi:phosphatidate cytidylyltransferase
MIWGNDVFAYFGGKTFGKHKMAPLISPKKTWEGFASGFLGAALVLIVGWFLAADLLSLSLTELLPMILLVSVFGPVGDLFASKIKRFTGSKDSGKLLPGHGGFFDRFDSLLLVSPSVYIYFSILNML